MVLCDDYDPDCPQFHSSVTKFLLPKGFKMPRIEPYDGTSDPDDHLRKFYVQMMVYGNISSQGEYELYRGEATHANAIFCRVFPCTLTGSALSWFFTLTPGSIRWFWQLTNPFLTQFKSYRTITSLSLKQGDDEFLKDYVDRCKRESEKADNIRSKDFLRLVIAGLKSGSFKDSLLQKPPVKLNDLWKRAALVLGKEDKYNKCTTNNLWKRFLNK